MDIHGDVPGDEATSVGSDAGGGGSGSKETDAPGFLDTTTVRVYGPGEVELIHQSGSIIVGHKLVAQAAADLAGALLAAALEADELAEG